MKICGYMWLDFVTVKGASSSFFQDFNIFNTLEKPKTGQFQNLSEVRVVDVFSMPQSGNSVSVEAVDPVFQAKMLDMLKQTGRRGEAWRTTYDLLIFWASVQTCPKYSKVVFHLFLEQIPGLLRDF